MKFDKQKWDAYVQEQGGNQRVAYKVVHHKYQNKNLLMGYLTKSLDIGFNPLDSELDRCLINCLGFCINQFIQLEPIPMVTGIETLRALCDGKVVRDIETDALYKIENNIYLIYHGNGAWDKAHIDISFLLLDKFEVIDAENN